MTKTGFTFVLKAGIIWGVILMVSALCGMLLGLGGPAAPDEGPFNAGQAFLLVNMLHALVLATIAMRTTLGGWRLGLLLGATLFLAQSFLLLIEALYFSGSVNVPMHEILAGGLISFVSAFGIGLVAALFWRRPGEAGPAGFQARQFLLPVMGVAALYVLSYFLAGFFIAWAVPDVRAYYGDGVDIELLPLLAFQLFRGSIWALLALAIVHSLKPGPVATALTVGMTFSVLAAAQLLYPNPFMPWAVRLPHLIEVTFSNFLFGAIAGIILQRRSG